MSKLQKKKTSKTKKRTSEKVKSKIEIKKGFTYYLRRFFDLFKR